MACYINIHQNMDLIVHVIKSCGALWAFRKIWLRTIKPSLYPGEIFNIAVSYWYLSLKNCKSFRIIKKLQIIQNY